jgi:hydrogenase large subunit
MVARDGANVESRVVARLVEVALVTIAMEHWIDVIDPAAPFQDTSPRLDTGDAMGLTEAAREAWATGCASIRGGSATTRSSRRRPGIFHRAMRPERRALEQALVGAPLRSGETEPVSVQHIVRSFDPCMVCTVH